MFEKNWKHDGHRQRGNQNEGFHGGHGGRGGPGDLLTEKRKGNESAQILFVGSVNCLRHKPYMEIGKLMQDGKASILCPTMSDFSSGKYLNQVEEAIEELAAERNCKDFVIICGCQWVILSTDGEMIKSHLKEKGINIVISEDDHLKYGDHE